jgi:succinyl-diaminopimelate desuccinylase
MVAARAALERDLRASRDELIELCARLVRAPSENPPGDTRAVVGAVRERLAAEAVDIAAYTARDPIENLVVRVRGAGPGRRLVFNGHLDTFPVGDAGAWSVDPLGGIVRDGRIYGRGVSDMKAGLAASLHAVLQLARYREAWKGEVVLTFAGDEETMGPLGTKYLLDTVPEASGDAMITGDAGSPRVVRFGEKGLLWLRLVVGGRAAHGAHVHLGENAAEHLMDALGRLRTLAEAPVALPAEIENAVAAAAPVSEALSGAGETRVLTSVTVNVGRLNAGSKINLVPDRAEAEVDIRLPVGITVDRVLEEVAGRLVQVPQVSFEVIRRFEPNYTGPSAEIVQLVMANAAALLGQAPVATMRVGASDSRYYRERGIPSVVYGPTPINMGGPDEAVSLDDLFAVAEVHALTAFDFLNAR